MKKRNQLREVLATVALRLLDEQDTPSAAEIVATARLEQPDVFLTQADTLIEQRAMREVEDILRSYSVDDLEPNGQMRFPEIKFPTVIAVGDGRFVLTEKANWKQLQVGLDFRERNVARATAMRDAYLESVETVRPFMEHQPDAFTLADAKRAISASGQAAS